MEDLVIIKLGGSFITDKRIPFSINQEAIDRAVSEIAVCLKSGTIKKLIIVHGVGSHGHPPVLKHKLHKGFQEKSQLLAMTETQHIVNQLRMKLMDSFLKARIPAFLTHASSYMTADRMKIKEVFTNGISGYLNLGMIPIVGGDMLADESMGFSVGSGDQMTVWLAEHFKAKRILFIADVNGVFESDPKTHPEAKVIPKIEIDTLKDLTNDLEEKHPKDASGGMTGKLESMLKVRPLLEKGVKIHILSLQQAGTLMRLLKGKETLGTELIIKTKKT